MVTIHFIQIVTLIEFMLKVQACYFQTYYLIAPQI